MDKKRVKALPCEIWSRVVGYYRPTMLWNEGKKKEFEERKTVSLNSIKNFTKGGCVCRQG